MDPIIENFIKVLEQDIRIAEEQLRFWEDPRIIGMDNIGGSQKTGAEIGEALRRRITEWVALVYELRKKSS